MSRRLLGLLMRPFDIAWVFLKDEQSQQMMDLNRRHAELNNSLQDYLAAGDFQGADAIRQQIEMVNGEIARMQSASQGE